MSLREGRVATVTYTVRVAPADGASADTGDAAPACSGAGTVVDASSAPLAFQIGAGHVCAPIEALVRTMQIGAEAEARALARDVMLCAPPGCLWVDVRVRLISLDAATFPSRAERLKAEGNLLFQAKQYKPAARRYRKVRRVTSRARSGGTVVVVLVIALFLSLGGSQSVSLSLPRM